MAHDDPHPRGGTPGRRRRRQGAAVSDPHGDSVPAIAIYARVSTDEQARHGASLAAQVRACRERIEDPAAPVREFVDAGVSGATLDRPALAALRDAARRGGIRRLLVLDPDRLSRVLAHQLLLADEFTDAGVPPEFVTFEWQQTPEGQLFFALRGAIAEFEREKIRERVQRGWLQKAHDGTLPSNAQRFGYQQGPTGVEVNPTTAPMVVRIFQMAADGATAGTIARQLAAEGIPPPRGRAWWPEAIIKILKNPAYLGLAPVHPYGAPPDAAPLWIPVPTLVDRPLFDAAQRTLARNRRTGRPPTTPALLKGLVRCGRCGNAIGRVRVTQGRVYQYYYCYGRAVRRWEGTTPAARCRLPYLPAADLEAAVWERVVATIRDPSTWGTEAVATPVDPRPALRRIRRAQTRLLALVRDGLISERAVRRDLAQLREQEAALHRPLPPAGPSAAEQVQARWGSDLSQLPTADRITVLQLLVDTITVDVADDGALDVVLRFRQTPGTF